MLLAPFGRGVVAAFVDVEAGDERGERTGEGEEGAGGAEN